MQYGQSEIQNLVGLIVSNQVHPSEDEAHVSSEYQTALVPDGPANLDSMMEEKLVGLEKELRAEFDSQGLTQPEDDWHWNQALTNSDV